MEKKITMKLFSAFMTLSLILQIGGDIVKERILREGTEGDNWHANHMIVSDWNKVYIGGINRIYELDTDLEVLNEAITGPKYDSPKCLPLSSCNHEKVLTDNHNKVLLLYIGTKEKLITCGSVFQGACEARNINNISRMSEYYSSESGTVSDFAVAANTEQGSTVAFIAPGPPDRMVDVLYVATTYTGDSSDVFNSRIRDRVPAISSRNIGRNRFSFATAMDSIQGTFSGIDLIKDVRANYKINYISGFSSEVYSYFLTRQFESPTSSKMISKIVQICQEDSYFYSYVDMPLKCTSGSKDYSLIHAARTIAPSKNLQLSFGLRYAQDEILVGLFSTPDTGNGSDSAVCVFTMQYIRQKLLDNIKLCYSGQDVSGGSYLVQKQCPDLERLFRDKDYLCNRDLEAIGNIVGTIPAVAKPVLQFEQTTLTAVALSITADHTIALLGTKSGNIKKIVLETHERARQYSEIVIQPGSPINQDMHLDSTRQYAFVVSQNKVAKVKLNNCEKRTTCSSCLAEGDPFCGWCVLDNRCTQRVQCPVSSTDRWLFGPPEQTCVVITDVSPRTVSVTDQAELYLTIYSLPEGSDYTCVFTELGWISPAYTWSYGVHCRTPDIRQLGAHITGSEVLTVALNSSETGKVFIAHNFTYYNCSSFNSCSQCTNNTWSCDWCVYDNRCDHNSNFCQPDVVHSKAKESSGSGKRGPLHCPRIDQYQTGSIYLPEGVERPVKIKGVNLPMPQEYLNYHCQIHVGHRTYSSSANRTDDGSIICYLTPMMIPPSHIGGFYRAKVSVMWGDTYMLEDAEGLHVTLYKCEVLARGECGLCHSINYTNPELNCNWCDGNCKYQSNCKSWLKTPCPAPQIKMVFPLTGPIGGGTLVNISGKDLGSKFEEVQNAVTVAGIRCAPLREKYQPSQWIVCRLGTSTGPRSGVVKVSLPNRHSVQFQEYFSYQDPSISHIKPTIGPVSGGSRITIYGEHLNTGHIITASVGRVECRVTRDEVTNSVAYCHTNQVSPHYHDSEPFKMYFDGYEEKNVHVSFQYVADPTVTNISPHRSFISGGRKVTITGTNMDSVQEPRLFAIYNDLVGEDTTSDMSTCTAINNTAISCPTPQIPHKTLHARYHRVRREAHLSVQLGLVMDGVLSVQDLASGFPSVNSKMSYYPDPVVYNFTEPSSIKKFKGEVLIFEGKGLNLAATEEDIIVLIGRKSCNVTNLSSTQIFCTPPTEQPDGVDEHGNRDSMFPPVVVKIGNLRFQVGRLEYERVAALKFPMEYIIGIAAGGGFMLLVILLILVICRRQSHKAERNYRKMQLLLDNLESNVRNECKQAFAELQTDMTDFTGDLEGGGIPFWDYHTYTFKVLFPGLTDHVILHPPIIQPQNGNIYNLEHGLHSFYHLLSSKYFLLTFIRTLEDQKDQKAFGIRDKVNVASLLMIIYQDNMEYATEILKALLTDLVEKSVLGRHPKLMLRRTESVVEKLLTNWLSLCMYRYLKDLAGSSLFVLYKSVKLQVEKGPVDCLTGDARYTLSEDKLLREKIDPKLLTLHVFYEGCVTQCKVLNCDTITQAKEKIVDTLYRNIPFTDRPCVCDLDLEWKKGAIPVTLQDEDSTTVKSDGWKKLNTLQHYRVFDGAECALIRRYQTIKSPNGSLDTSVLSVTSSFPILRTESDTGAKYCHLVKHDDFQSKEGGVKMVPEVFLPRLLATKGTLQKYIDDFFRTILSVNPLMPPVIKYLFDFLDEAALKYGITDPDVLHTWKCNSLPLRFWVNIIKNPDFVFDINKPVIVDSCLSVVAQTFMDSCSTSEHRLGKDSPSNKLLFAKDIPNYRKMVDKFFRDIQEIAPVSDQEMSAYMADVSRSYPGKVFKSSALLELYGYVSKYSNELLAALEEDNIAIRLQLPAKLGQVISSMEGPNGRNRLSFV